MDNAGIRYFAEFIILWIRGNSTLRLRSRMVNIERCSNIYMHVDQTKAKQANGIVYVIYKQWLNQT